MKKILVLVMVVFPMLTYSKTDTRLINYYNKAIENFKPYSPECRRVLFVLSTLTDAYDNMNTKNYYTGVVFLCMAQFYYDMTLSEINFIFEHTGDYLAKHEEAMFGACMDVLEAKGDVAWTFYTSKTTQATLQNYVKKHSDKCSQQRGK